ncbi:hypothetical protein Tco_0432296 [Tanacetum coccineum]
MQENVSLERLHVLDQRWKERRRRVLLLYGRYLGSIGRKFNGNETQAQVYLEHPEERIRYNIKECNSGDDQLRLRWMIYLMVLANVAERVTDAIGFEYCLASSRDGQALYGRKCRSPVLGQR